MKRLVYILSISRIHIFRTIIFVVCGPVVDCSDVTGAVSSPFVSVTVEIPLSLDFQLVASMIDCSINSTRRLISSDSSIWFVISST